PLAFPQSTPLLGVFTNKRSARRYLMHFCRFVFAIASLQPAKKTLSSQFPYPYKILFIKELYLLKPLNCSTAMNRLTDFFRAAIGILFITFFANTISAQSFQITTDVLVPAHS